MLHVYIIKLGNPQIHTFEKTLLCLAHLVKINTNCEN